MTLSPADYAALNAAVADLRAWDARSVVRREVLAHSIFGVDVSGA